MSPMRERAGSYADAGHKRRVMVRIPRSKQLWATFQLRVRGIRPSPPSRSVGSNRGGIRIHDGPQAAALAKTIWPPPSARGQGWKPLAGLSRSGET